MTEINIEKIVRDLIDTFISAGEISINLRRNGLTKKIKSDNTPVSNGDLEVNKILEKKLIKVGENSYKDPDSNPISVKPFEDNSI